MTRTDAPATLAARRETVVLRPANAAIWTHMFGRLLAMFVPMLAVLALLTRPDRLPAFLVIGVLAAISGGLGAWFVSRARVEFRGDSFVEVGVSGTRTVPMRDVTGVTILHVYDTNGVGVRPHLFAVDGNGRALLRLRGRYWSERQMLDVAAHFDAPLARFAEPITVAELRRSRSSNLYWFERHPAIAGIGTGIGLLAVVLLIALVMTWALS